MQSQRWAWTHRHAVPMFVASLVALLLSGSALIAFLVFVAGDDADSADDRTALSECVVGTWQVVDYTEENSNGTARMVSGEPVFTFAADGTGEADYRDGATVEVDALGTVVEVDVTGEVSYRYDTSDDTLEFVEQDSNASMSGNSDLDVPGLGDLGLGDDEYNLPTGALGATCDDDSMTIAGDDTTFEYQRAG